MKNEYEMELLVSESATTASSKSNCGVDDSFLHLSFSDDGTAGADDPQLGYFMEIDVAE